MPDLSVTTIATTIATATIATATTLATADYPVYYSFPLVSLSVSLHSQARKWQEKGPADLSDQQTEVTSRSLALSP